MILGYTTDFSVLPGDPLRLHFSAQSGGQQARVHFYKWGLRPDGRLGWAHMAATSSMSIGAVAAGRPDRAWGWPEIKWTIPEGWSSGVYAAMAISDLEDGAKVDPETRRFEQVLFVVRAAAAGQKARILYKLPLLTYAAYNAAQFGSGGELSSLYDFGGPRTMHRPGIGCDPADADLRDMEDLSSPRQTFAHWDGKMIGWLESRRYSVDFCTDLDVHRDIAQLSRYRLLLSAGHDEYWTEGMRANVESFIDAGGNVAFLSGNVAWWHTVITEAKNDLLFERVGQWPAFSETRLSGVSWYHGGGKWSGHERREGYGYTLQRTRHWIFKDVVLPNGAPIKDGDVVGAEERLVGYEFDGAALMPELPGRPREPAYAEETPRSFVVLGVAQTPAWDTPGNGRLATMGIYSRNGIVFTAATTDWPRVLWMGHVTVHGITCNVLDRLSLASVDIRGPKMPGRRTDSAAKVGELACFRAADVPLEAHCQWTVDGAELEGPVDGSEVEILMPATPELVIVAVTVYTGEVASGFGMMAVRPVSAERFAALELATSMNDLIAAYGPSRLLVEGPSKSLAESTLLSWDPARTRCLNLGHSELRVLKSRLQALLLQVNARLDDTVDLPPRR